jgi:hypothetical protein
MKFNYKNQEISLQNLTRLYGAVVIDMQGEVAEMSLEWYELYGEKVKLINYVLVFDYTPPGENVRDKKVLEFATQDELIEEMQRVAQFFQK